jgi:hypothetical protein
VDNLILFAIGVRRIHSTLTYGAIKLFDGLFAWDHGKDGMCVQSAFQILQTILDSKQIFIDSVQLKL